MADDPSEILVTESNVKIGLRVVRGRDWEYGNQDGKPPGKGTITGRAKTAKWWTVEWDHDGASGFSKSDNYRVGKDGKYDLQMAGKVRRR